MKKEDIKDWYGNSKSTFANLGASNHSSREREARDFYATSPLAVECLLKVEDFNHKVWECACGKGHISNVLKAYGYEVRESDIEDRMRNEVLDFLLCEDVEQEADIVTNPPYSHAQEFIEPKSVIRS